MGGANCRLANGGGRLNQRLVGAKLSQPGLNAQEDLDQHKKKKHSGCRTKPSEYWAILETFKVDSDDESGNHAPKEKVKPLCDGMVKVPQPNRPGQL